MLKLEEIFDLKNEFEDVLLEFFFETLYDTKYKFWYDVDGNLCDFIISEKFNDKIMYNQIYNNEIDEIYINITNNYNNKIVKKGENSEYLRRFFKKYYYMIDIEKFLETIHVHCVVFEGDILAIEFSSSICEYDGIFSHVVMEITSNNMVSFNV